MSEDIALCDVPAGGGFEDSATSECGRMIDEVARLGRENARLRDALAAADKAIVAGQSCRTEAEFTRWMHESQQARPHADLIFPNASSARIPGHTEDAP